MNKKQYASSVYSQKSTTSAKSGRSFLSFSTSLWKASRNTDDNDKQQQQQQKWYNIKNWIPLKATGDNDSTKSIITNSTNSSSISKIKRLLFISSTSPSSTPTDSPKPPSSLDTTDSSSPNNEQTFYRPPQKNGILINRDGESTDQHRRRKHKRRENIVKLQQHHQHHFHFRRLDSKNHQTTFALEPPPMPPTTTTTTTTTNESSSSDTLLGDPDQHLKQKSVSFNNDQDEHEFNPRIIFVEPSPVPRFRNVAPPPPPSPPYMSILIEDDMDQKSNSRSSFQSIINTLDEDDEDDDSAPPTIYTSRSNIKQELEMEHEEEDELGYCENEHERRMTLLLQTLYSEANRKPPRLYFKSPFHRGQTIQFQLQNTIPEDNIILFKFLTSNNNSMEERYFIRPSAGKILSGCQLIMLFLNQIPARDEKKDKILVKYAVIQRNTRVEDWLMKLNDNTRRKWIDMVEEEWPELVKSTRIRIRFV